MIHSETSAVSNARSTASRADSGAASAPRPWARIFFISLAMITAMTTSSNAQMIAHAFWKISNSKYLQLTGPSTVVAGTSTCSAAFTVSIVNKSGSVVAIGSATSIAITQMTNPSSAGFFSDSACSSALPTSSGKSVLNFAATDSQKTFYYNHDTDEPTVLQATPSSALTAVAYPVANYIPPLINASFKSPTIPNGTYPNETSISGWSGNFLMIAAGGAYNNSGSQDGLQYAGIQYTETVSQTLSSWMAGQYFAQYKGFGRIYGGANEIQTKIDSTVISDTVPPQSTWTRVVSSSFTLAAGSHTLTFTGLDPGGTDQTTFIEQVGVFAYAKPPAPTSQALISVGTNLFLSLARVPQAVSYTLYYRTAGSTGSFSSLSFTEPQKTITSIASPSSMEYYLSSTNAIGEGPKGSVFSVNSYTDVTSKITNPSFESPVLSSGAYQYNSPVTGWNVASGSGICNNGCPFAASGANATDGVQVAYMQYANNATIEQNVSSLNANSNYILTFDSSQRGGQSSDCTISLNGSFLVFTAPGGAYVTYSSALGTSDSSGNLDVFFHGINSSASDNSCLVDNLHLYQIN